MASCSFTHSGSDRIFTLTVNEDPNSISVANNTSSVNWSLTISNGSGYYYDTYVKATVNGTVVYNDTKAWNSYAFPAGDGTVSGTVSNIQHGSDGSKSISFSVEGYAYTYDVQSASGSLALTTIPRASTPSVNYSSRELGNAITISTNRASNAFTHTINIKDGSTTIETFTNIGASKSWTPSISTYAPRITTATSKAFTIECITYNGSSNLGTKTCSVTLTVPASVKPTASISVSKGDNIVPSSWGVYVKTKSKVTVNVTGTQAYSSPISSYTTNIGGSTLIGASVTSGTLNTSGTINISSTVTDARGRTSNAATSSITVVDYSSPSITTALAERCDSNGVTKDDGTYLKYSFVGSISSVSNKNSKLFRIGYKERAASTYTYVTIENSSYSVNQQSQILSGVTFDASKTWDLLFEAVDTFSTTQISKTLNTGFDLINFNESGKSIAFGKMSEASPTDAKMEIALDTIISNNFAVTGIANKFLHHQGNAPTDLNTARRHGTYRIGGTYTNAPSTSAIYGVLIVYVSLGTYWVPSDTSNWIWQELRYTSGEIFVREAVNNETFSAWKRVGVQTNTRNTSDTWIPVIKNGALDYTTRYMPTGKTHSQWETEQDRLVTLKFMSFWDGAYNSSHNSNLTYAHQGTIQCKPTSLYDNGTGTNGTVTLSQTSANFSVLEIYYRSNNTSPTTYDCVRVWSPNGKTASMIIRFRYDSAGYTQYDTKRMTISGTSITNVEGTYSNTQNGACYAGNQNTIYITKVLGYKY